MNPAEIVKAMYERLANKFAPCVNKPHNNTAIKSGYRVVRCRRNGTSVSLRIKKER